MQIAATLVKGKARVQFDANKVRRADAHEHAAGRYSAARDSNNLLFLQAVYSLAKAQQSFKSLVQIHQKSGWYTPPKEDG